MPNITKRWYLEWYDKNNQRTKRYGDMQEFDSVEESPAFVKESIKTIKFTFPPHKITDKTSCFVLHQSLLPNLSYLLGY